MRGRHRATNAAVWIPRLIPAGAGQTPQRGFNRVLAGAHPRRCGADGHLVDVGHADGGSSPQVRGRHHRRPQHRSRVGLIPAGAGQTTSTGIHSRPNTAHPRRCGADFFFGMFFGVGPGSSPQVRGRPDCCCDGWSGDGLIPAGAGQTAARRSTMSCARAHPRRCGAGPRVGRHALERVGLIPAGAGQTSTRSGN